MRIALYARVSSRHAFQTHTIDQQLARLRVHCREHPDWTLDEEHIFCDEGYSGAMLKRPALDRLRDAAAQAAVDRVLITAPDRLARNFVHQTLLLEEFERVQCPVDFLERPLTNDPHDQLLLQIRGAVAEYERTLIGERMRRGRLARLRGGRLLPWTRAPYGYQPHPEHPRDPTLVMINPIQAAIVRELFERYADGGLSLHALAVDLTNRQVVSPGGLRHWSSGGIRLLLCNPCYWGMAYGHRTQTRPAQQRQSPLRATGRRGTGWVFRPESEWVGVPIPAIVSRDLFERVRARLATNQRFATRSATHDYLLRGLVSCGHCRLRCTGLARNPKYRYYLCCGRRHPAVNSHDQRCRARQVPADQLEQLVWTDLCAVIQDPTLITTALERVHAGAWEPESVQQRRTMIQRALRSVDDQRERLMAAYLSAVIELPELERRQRELGQQREDLEIQLRQLATATEHLAHARLLIPTIEALCTRLQAGLGQATREQQRHLIELLIDCVVVTDDHVEIRYVIPTTEASTHIRFCHLRKDYFLPPPARIFMKNGGGIRQVRDEIPDHGLKARSLVLVDTDRPPPTAGFPDAHLEEGSCDVRPFVDALQRHPPFRGMLHVGVCWGTNDVIPA